tara:strand:+ start:1647 stop:2402 length:756 start_codon:yes stop_codon:yes gene_type:complete
MDRFIYIRNAEDDAYMNTSANFRGMEQASSGVVIMYFESPISSSVGANAYDKITLAVTANSEKEAMSDIAGALVGGKSGTTAVIADDYGNASCSDNISTTAGVTTISKATGGQTKRLIAFAADKTLTAGDSGSWVHMTDAGTEKELILPAAAAGLEFHVFINIAQTGDTAISIPSGYFIGGFDMSDPTTATDTNFFQSDGDSNDYINLDSDAKGRLQGGYMNFVCDGTNWHVQGHLVGDGTLATPFADSES